MTTLDVQIGQLRTAVAPYPVVKDLRVEHPVPARDADPRDRAAPGRRAHRRRPVGRGQRRRHAAARASSTASLPEIPVRAAPGRRARHRPRRARRARRCSRPPPVACCARIAQVADEPVPRPRRAAALRPEHLLRRRLATCARSGPRPPRCWPTRARPARPTSTSPIRPAPPREPVPRRSRRRASPRAGPTAHIDDGLVEHGSQPRRTDSSAASAAGSTTSTALQEANPQLEA